MLCSIVIISRAKVNYIIKKAVKRGRGDQSYLENCTVLSSVWRKE